MPKKRLEKTSLYGNMQHIKCKIITGMFNSFPVVNIMNSSVHFRPIKWNILYRTNDLPNVRSSEITK